jgi:hypothetical protein
MAIADRLIHFDKLPEGYTRLSPPHMTISAPGNSEQYTQFSVQTNAAPLRDSLPAVFSSDIYTRQLYPDTPYFTRNMPPVQTTQTTVTRSVSTTAK